MNITGKHYKVAIVTSVMVHVAEVTVVLNIISAGWQVIIFYAIGMTVGIVTAMYYHERIIKFCTTESSSK